MATSRQYAARFQKLIDSASDKEAVRSSIGARLYLNATMGGNVPPTSSKDAEIDAIISEFEGDADMSGSISRALKLAGGKRRRTRKLTRKTRKTRKYSRRR